MSSEACPAADGSSPKRQEFSGPPPMCIDATKRYTAEMVTNKGTMTIELDAVNAPKTVNNFVFLARYHYYEGVIFHRVIQGFVIQGGDPTGTGRGGPGYRFEDEPVKNRYERGSLAMANAGPNTNGSQFFVITGPSGEGLPPQYNHFGRVTSGHEVYQQMEAVPTDRADRPKDDLVIESVTITESAA